MLGRAVPTESARWRVPGNTGVRSRQAFQAVSYTFSGTTRALHRPGMANKVFAELHRAAIELAHISTHYQQYGSVPSSASINFSSTSAVQQLLSYPLLLPC